MAPLAHTLALLAMTVATAAIEVLPLDTAQNSFDDQYQGCGPAMTEALPALNRSEFQQNPLFAQAWVKATAAWHKKVSAGSPLSPAQAVAVMAYTMRDVYKEFNAAVREAGRSRQEYRDNFHFKVLHFLLTDALAALRDAQGQKCREVFRGVRGVQFKARPGDAVRFGQFTSTSPLKAVAEKFGTDTMFRVETCQGVAVQNYSAFPSQQEVLIPPFETFSVTEFTPKGNTAEIRLRSTGTRSNYNCEWLRGGSIPRDPPPLEGSFWQPRPWQWSPGPSEPRGHQGHRGHCGHRGHRGHQDHQGHQDAQSNEATKATKTTTGTVVTLATRRPP